MIAANGGSEYYYVLDHTPATVAALVRALQERRAYGAIFVRSNYGAIPGTLPLSAINAEGGQSSPPTPDLIVSFDWDDAAVAGGNAAVPGTEYASAQRYRGMHGSFSPRDVHNVLIAHGPHFKSGFQDRLPSSNVDVAPTVAQLLALPFKAPDGRVLVEALAGDTSDNQVEISTRSSGPVALRRTCSPDDPGCARPLGPVDLRRDAGRENADYGGHQAELFLSRSRGCDPRCGSLVPCLHDSHRKSAEASIRWQRRATLARI